MPKSPIFTTFCDVRNMFCVFKSAKINRYQYLFFILIIGKQNYLGWAKTKSILASLGVVGLDVGINFLYLFFCGCFSTQGVGIQTFQNGWICFVFNAVIIRFTEHLLLFITIWFFIQILGQTILNFCYPFKYLYVEYSVNVYTSMQSRSVQTNQELPEKKNN